MDPSSSRHRDYNLHPNPPHNHLCNNYGINSNSTNLASAPLVGGNLAPSLSHQLTQQILCNNQTYPLLALQQNFSHLLAPNFSSSQQLNNTLNHTPHEPYYRNQRSTSTSQHHNLHHRHHDHEHNPTHHQRSHHNWRKSKPQAQQMSSGPAPNGGPLTLLDLSAKTVAEHIPFQSIEERYEHIPEPVQKRIIFWSFPRHENDIKMYSSLSSDTFNSNAPTLSSINTSNTATQSPSSNLSFSWVDQQSIQGNTPSNQVATTTKPNNKQLTFHKGLRLYDEGCVHNALQVGFNLTGLVNIRLDQAPQPTSNSRSRHSTNINNANSNIHNNDFASNQNHVATVSTDSPGTSSTSDIQITKSHKVSVTFDRCKITSVSCSCEIQDIFWCEHVVALVIYRIRNPETIDLRIPISETLASLDRQQLQKLVQYLISEHHTDVLPTAQRLLDQMRLPFSEINQIAGAPDPTAGACSDDEHIWHMDENQVNDKVQNYLNLVFSNSKDASRQINALFEKIREMFRAKDSNGTRLLKLITEQFLLFATRNEKSRSLWDQLSFLWVVVMLNPDLSKIERGHFVQLLNSWSRATKCPREDIERRVSIKRKITELLEDEDSDDSSHNSYNNDYSSSHNRSNNYPAHMATHRRSFQPENGFPVLRPFNQLASACSCQMPHELTKKQRTGHQPIGDQEATSSRALRPSSSGQLGPNRLVGHQHNANENRPAAVQEPKSVFQRAIDFKNASWDDPHLQMILNKSGPVDFNYSKSHLLDFACNPLWHEPISHTAARIETLRSYGYREQALRLTVASVRWLKLQQDQWCLASSPESGSHSRHIDFEVDVEGWIGHPFDPINVMLDLLLGASMTEPTSTVDSNTASSSLCSINSSRSSCPYNQALVDFTLASFSYQHRNEAFPLLPLVNLQTRRSSSNHNHSSLDKPIFFHIPVPGCCSKDSYLTLGVELALIALGQQRSIPTVATAHERAVRQESELISKLESIDISDPLLIEKLKHQASLLLESGPFETSYCGMSTDLAPLHTFAKYLFESLAPHYSQLAYKIGVFALKMPLLSDENTENIGAARTSPRLVSLNHSQSEQLALAQTMISRAKDEKQFDSYLRKVYRASIKNIRNPSNLHKLSKHVLKEAKSGASSQQPVYQALLHTASELGLQVLKMTLTPHSSNSKTRREAILFIVECATDMGLGSVIKVMNDASDNFSATEAINLVISRDNDPVNTLRSQAISKLKLKDSSYEFTRLNQKSRDLALECAVRDPTNCALDAIKFCQADEVSLLKALTLVKDAGASGLMDSTQLIKVADYILGLSSNISDHNRITNCERAFEISLVAVDSLASSSNLDNPSAKKDIYKACDYAKEVGRFSILIPKLLNIESAYVLSDIYDNYGPKLPLFDSDGRPINCQMASYLNIRNPRLQDLEDLRWWDALLKRTMETFVDSTRSKLQNISPRHYGEFIDFLLKAKGIFAKANGGPKQFEGLIAEILKSYRTKKKLMEKLKTSFGIAGK